MLVLATEALTIFFSDRETSDSWGDALLKWWQGACSQFPGIQRLVIYLDNGPHNAGYRTQFLKRIVEFVDRTGLEVRLVYYPPYHSKYNPIERCWGALEQKWNGTLLSHLKIVLQWALRMTWCKKHPTVKYLHGDYPTGVKLSKAEMQPIEARLKRSDTLPKYDITITPKEAKSG